MTRRFQGAALVAALALLLGSSASHAKCDPTTEPDKTDIANARDAVALNCDCAGAVNHGQFVKCAGVQADATLVNKSCKGQVKRCAAKSTCGKPGFVTCCKRNAKGKVTCAPKPDASKCKAPNNGEACASTVASCCDACSDANHPPCASPSGAFLDQAAPF
jgi:hypothetical protein